MSNKSIYWIGKYESDIINSNFFVGSLTYYGSNLGNNYSFCPQGIRISSMRTNDFICFLTEKIDKIMNDSNNNASFMFYSPKWAYEILRVRPEYEYSFIGVNSQQIVSLLDNKINTRLWFSNICDTPPFKIAAPNECSYELLKNSFPKYEKFIIQEHISSGGKGTYVLTEKNNAQIVAQLNPSSIYIVSPYIVNSYPVNIHICISSNDVIVFSPSIQIMHNHKNNLLYCGADYISAKRIPNKILLEIKQVSQKIGFLIKDMEYRGVLGIDFIVEKDHVYFVEINPRFQGSSFLLNKALLESTGNSLFELHESSFTSAPNFFNENEISIDYSFIFYKKLDTDHHYNFLHEVFETNENYQILDDGYKVLDMIDSQAYLYRVIINKAISYINPDSSLNVLESLHNNNNFNIPISTVDDLLGLKVSLITQGVRIERSALEHINRTKRIKDSTFNAIDIKLFDSLIVNSPISVPFVELTPFLIKYNPLTKLNLYFNEHFISTVSVDTEDDLPEKTQNGNIPYRTVAFRTNDRVRVRHSSVCSFKLQNLSCEFCESKHKKAYEVPLEDVYEVIDTYEEQVDFRHYLIGGASGPENHEHERIIQIASYIKSKSPKSIYLMSLPPKDKNIIDEYFKSGITEVAFNLETYDRDVAKKIMPGKGRIPMSQYIEAFKESVKHLGNTGNVRTMFILGLESETSLLTGIEHMASIGVSPMLSALRPMPNTKLNDVITPSVQWICDIYRKAKAICEKYNLDLGPQCAACQNNTISLPKIYDEIINNYSN